MYIIPTTLVEKHIEHLNVDDTIVQNYTMAKNINVVVTKENIDFLSQYLKTTDFTWQSGCHVTDSTALILGNVPAFGVDRVLVFGTHGVWTNLFTQIEDYRISDFSDAVNYLFVDY